MENPKRLFTMLVILLAIASQIHAQEVYYDAIVNAEKWYSDHGHTDADGCHPPTRGGTERGGGTPYGI